jgi:hypothetical protein
MKHEDRLKKLADRARLEASPDVDVADRVMAAIELRESHATDILSRLARLSKDETPPEVDVTRRVMTTLRRRWADTPAPTRALGWVAGMSMAAAVPLVIAAATTWSTWVDPVIGVFNDTPWILP